jgi:hypothetical protein
MSRNRTLLLALVILLAVTSFGFTAYPTNGPITAGGFLRCPPGYHLERGGGIFLWHCVKDPANNDTPFIQNNLATVKVSPQLAAVLALFDQPAGSVATNVSGLYIGTIPPYYEVTIVYGNYVKSVYINAMNGNILPPQYNHPTQPTLFIK